MLDDGPELNMKANDDENVHHGVVANDLVDVN